TARQLYSMCLDPRYWDRLDQVPDHPACWPELADWAREAYVVGPEAYGPPPEPPAPEPWSLGRALTGLLPSRTVRPGAARRESDPPDHGALPIERSQPPAMPVVVAPASAGTDSAASAGRPEDPGPEPEGPKPAGPAGKPGVRTAESDGEAGSPGSDASLSAEGDGIPDAGDVPEATSIAGPDPDVALDVPRPRLAIRARRALTLLLAGTLVSTLVFTGGYWTWRAWDAHRDAQLQEQAEASRRADEESRAKRRADEAARAREASVKAASVIRKRAVSSPVAGSRPVSEALSVLDGLIDDPKSDAASIDAAARRLDSAVASATSAKAAETGRTLASLIGRASKLADAPKGADRDAMLVLAGRWRGVRIDGSNLREAVDAAGRLKPLVERVEKAAAAARSARAEQAREAAEREAAARRSASPQGSSSGAGSSSGSGSGAHGSGSPYRRSYAGSSSSGSSAYRAPSAPSAPSPRATSTPRPAPKPAAPSAPSGNGGDGAVLQ
ncbi:Fe-S osidoreductase, partial [Bifidobacterium margollesii]